MSEFNVNDNEEQFDAFKEIFLSDVTLPRTLETILLRRYFKVCGGDSEKALGLLKSNLALREQGPQIFSNRDALSSTVQTMSKIVQVCPLPKLTEDNKRIVLVRFTTSDTSQYCCVEVIKMMLMILDARYAMFDEDNKLCDADILVLDLNGYNFKHFLNAMRHPKTIYLYFKYIQEAVPVATVAAHILNPSWAVDRFMSFIRPILKKEVAESFRFHSNGLDDFHESVSKDVLPKEYGGNLGSINDIHQSWMEEFESKRDYLMDDDNWKLSS